MEFAYDEDALNQEATEKIKKDQKTNEAFDKLENELGGVYEIASSKLKSLVKEDKDGIKLDLPIDEATTKKAQEYLSTLDSNLAQVENVASSYWNKVTTPNFWSSVTDKLSVQLDNVINLTATEEKNQTTGNTSSIAGNRTEAEIKKLCNNKDIYLKYEKINLNPNFDIEGKTEEISKILESNKELEALMNSIVPQEIKYKDFWNIYFVKKSEIVEMEEKRKKLLEEAASREEEICWDDDDDNDETREESPVIVKKEDAIEASTEPKREISSEKTETNKTIEEEEDDDDWE